jgi:dGTPase
MATLSIRELKEKQEKEELSIFATLSANTKGRTYKERECDIRTAFQRDRDRIIHSFSFRQLKYKTQVFLAPKRETLRTRLTHTIEVAQISRTIAKALKLNEDLTEAIALGHDLGHPPFGHAGEEMLDELISDGFKHNLQSLRTVELLEKDGEGLNLTYEVKDGILKHSRGDLNLLVEPEDKESLPITLEGQIVRLADSITYINHDIEDAILAGIIKYKDIPSSPLQHLGRRYSARINSMVRGVIESSLNKPKICMEEGVLKATEELRQFLYSEVYRDPRLKKEAEKAKNIIKALFYYFTKDGEEELLKKMKKIKKKDHGVTTERLCADYIALLSDREAIWEYQRIFLPSPWI